MKSVANPVRVLLLVCLLCGCAKSYEKDVHYSMVYALAVSNGFMPHEAKIIADGSWSLDVNDSTTAYSPSKLKREGKEKLSGNATYPMEDLPHMVSGQLFHALTPHRDRVEQFHLERLRRLHSGDSHDGSRTQRENLELFYYGQYLHFVADTVVHPNNALIGHALEGHTTDEPEVHPDRLPVAIEVVSRKLRQFREFRDSSKELKPLTTTSQDGEVKRIGLTKLEAELARTIIDSHSSYRNFREQFADGITPSGVVYKDAPRHRSRDWSDEDEVRFKEARIAEVLRRHDMDYAKYEKVIEVDASGIPIDKPENRQKFGQERLRREDRLVERVLQDPTLAGQRKDEIDAAKAVCLYTPIKTLYGWELPRSPGGIALSPELETPTELGAVQRVSFDEYGHVVFETVGGNFPIPDLDVRTLATMLRTVSAGEIPYVSIGTEPSDRSGFARVTYCRSLLGTREGEALYEADVQFKGILFDFPFGVDYTLNTVDDELVRGYPGIGGESERFWITCLRPRLVLEDGVLRVQEHGMRVLSETKLQGLVVADPQLDDYTAKITTNWSEIAEVVPSFQYVQQMALATAIAFWARENRVSVDELVLTIPPRWGHTPLYSPVVAHIRPTISAAGGVALTPEEKQQGPARRALYWCSRELSRNEQINGVLVGRWGMVATTAVLIVVYLAVLSAVMWIIARWSQRGQEKHVKYRTVFVVYALVVASHILVAGLLAPLSYWEWMTWFDRFFIPIFVSFVVGPWLLWFWIRRFTEQLGNLYERLQASIMPGVAMILFGLTVPFSSTLVGVWLCIITVSCFGSVPGSAMERVLMVQLSSGNMLGLTIPIPFEHNDSRTILLPTSVLAVNTSPFTLPLTPVDTEESETIQIDGTDPTTPINMLVRIKWPNYVSVDPNAAHYSPDGRPPAFVRAPPDWGK